MINVECHVCHTPQLFDVLETAERHGWSRSAGGWIWESYDCYMTCDHQRLGLHQEAPEQASEAEGLGVC